jgi:hypothetical protein
MPFINAATTARTKAIRRTSIAIDALLRPSDLDRVVLAVSSNCRPWCDAQLGTALGLKLHSKGILQAG